MTDQLDNPLDVVNPFHPELLPHETVGLSMAKDKHQRYIAKGRTREAQGCASAILIMWQALMGESTIDTGWGEL